MLKTINRAAALALCAGVVALAAGCATPPEPPVHEVKAVPLPEPQVAPPAHVSVEWVALDPHRVIGGVDGYRHVLIHRSVESGVGVKDQDTDAGAQVGDAGATATDDAGGGVSAEPAHEMDKTPGASPLDPTVNAEAARREADTAEELSAWRRFCDGESVDENATKLMAATKMPSALEGHCKPGWHGEK